LSDNDESELGNGLGNKLKRAFKRLKSRDVELQPIIPRDNQELIVLREIMSKAIQNSTLTSEKILENASQISRWILASLVTINGGGAIAVGSASRIPTEAASHAIGAFVIGIILAVLSGLSGASAASKQAAPVANLAAHYIESHIKGQLTVEAQLASEKLIKRAAWFTRLTTTVGLLSLGAFAWGAYTAATAFSVLPAT